MCITWHLLWCYLTACHIDLHRVFDWFSPHTWPSLLFDSSTAPPAILSTARKERTSENTQHPYSRKVPEIYRTPNTVLLRRHDSILRSKIWYLTIFHVPQVLLVSTKVFPSAAGMKKKWKRSVRYHWCLKVYRCPEVQVPGKNKSILLHYNNHYSRDSFFSFPIKV